MQRAQLNKYIDNDNYLKSRRGSYANGNGAPAPVNQQQDLMFMHTIQTGAAENPYSIGIVSDVFNLSNLIHKNWGRQYYVPNILNSSYHLLTVVRSNMAAPPELNFSNPTSTPWQVDPLLSRHRDK